MKAWLTVVFVALATLVGGCTTMDEGAGGGMETLDAKGLAKVFKRGSKYCKWDAGDMKGEDFYYTTSSSKGGDADRNVGDKTLQGTWAVKGDQLCLNFGGESCYKVHQVDKKNFKAIGGNGQVAMSMSC